MRASQGLASKASKFFLLFAGALAAAACGFMILNAADLETEQGYIERDRELVGQIRKIVPTLKTYVQAGITAKERQDEQSKGNWLTFFDSVANVSGFLSDQYVLPSPREIRGKNFIEYRFDIKLKDVRRKDTARFLWEVEKRRSYLRSCEVKLQRPRKAGDEDVWEGQVVIGYREKQ